MKWCIESVYLNRSASVLLGSLELQFILCRCFRRYFFGFLLSFFCLHCSLISAKKSKRTKAKQQLIRMTEERQPLGRKRIRFADIAKDWDTFWRRPASNSPSIVQVFFCYLYLNCISFGNRVAIRISSFVGCFLSNNFYLLSFNAWNVDFAFLLRVA